MSIFDDIAEGAQKGFQATKDLIGGGPQAIEQRRQLEQLQNQQQQLITQYKTEQPETAAWITPINQTCDITTSILQKTSDYVQGIMFSYKEMLDLGSSDVATVNEVAKAAITPLTSQLSTDLDIDATYALASFNLLDFAADSLDSLVADDMALPGQIDAVTAQNQQITNAIEKLSALRANLMALESYLFSLCTHSIQIYQQSADVAFSGTLPLSADSPQVLQDVNNQLASYRDKLESVNGNTFMIYRILINLLKNNQLKGVGTSDQLNYLTKHLYDIPSVQQAFASQQDVESLITNFLQTKQLAVAPLFLELPPVPATIQPMISQTPAKQSEFDLYSEKYDPPGDLDLSSLP